ncbi:hypothetical protein AC578_4870 [Pseudocercospora eumusae]|uniref:HpcH/HpaI aldolase/citrate lyase domain-containing protein n=1 Tax=Pseudocercospora eumusae TaxID=321146 RepID=A0A139HC48_9PEZI|nr:hypothetical protein AC578_4870 [Pseudocercospora eumusae]KXT00032.1 hypothetical protein AC578_4870 [Pseudocercospora eumusae]
MPILKLLNKLKSNEPIISTFMALGGFRHAQILAHTGLDAIIIDREHGTYLTSPFLIPSKLFSCFPRLHLRPRNPPIRLNNCTSRELFPYRPRPRTVS